MFDEPTIRPNFKMLFNNHFKENWSVKQELQITNLYCTCDGGLEHSDRVVFVVRLVIDDCTNR